MEQGTPEMKEKVLATAAPATDPAVESVLPTESKAGVAAPSAVEAEKRKVEEDKERKRAEEREEEEQRWFAGEARKRPRMEAGNEGLLKSSSRIAGKVADAMPGTGLIALPVLGIVMGLGMFGGGLTTVALALWGVKLGLEAVAKVMTAADEKIDSQRALWKNVASGVSRLFGDGGEDEAKPQKLKAWREENTKGSVPAPSGADVPSAEERRGPTAG